MAWAGSSPPDSLSAPDVLSASPSQTDLLNARRFRVLLPIGVYAIFIWRMAYSFKHFTLRTLDWVVPAAGLALWAVACWRGREPWPRTRADWPLLAWSAALAWAAVWSVNPRISLYAVWDAAIGLFILWLLVYAIRRGWGGPLLQVVYLLAGVVCLVGMIEFLAWYFGWPLLPAFQQGWFSIGGLADPIPPVIRRLGVALVNITALSAFLALLIPLALCVLLSARRRDVRWGAALWLLAAGLILFLSGSRGGLFGVGVSLPLIALGAALSPRLKRWRSRLLGSKAARLLAGALLLALLAAALAGFLVLVQGNAGEHESGDAVRLDLWRSALAMFREHPLTGIGTGAFGTALREYRDPLLARDHVPTAHNLYLNTAAEGGLPALVAGALLLLTVVWAWWRRWRGTVPGTPAWWRLLGIGGGLVGLAAQSTVDTFLEPAVVLVVLLFVAQVLAVQPPPQAGQPSGRRWPWPAVIVVLVLGAAAWAWESVGAASFSRSLTLTARGQIDEALTYAERAQAADSLQPLYDCQVGYLQARRAASDEPGALPLAVESYRLCLAAQPVPGWVDQLDQGVVLWAAGQRDEARAAVVRATDQTPMEWIPWLSRGFWAETEGDRGEAVLAYGQVLALNPSLAGSPFWQQTGRVELWDEISAAGEEVVRSFGYDAPSWRWGVLLAGGRPGVAVEEIEAWLEAHPGDPWAAGQMGESLLELDRAAEAVPHLDALVAADPARAASYVVRGRAYLALGQYDAAEKDLRTALFLAPGCDSHLALARLAQARYDVPLALDEYRRAMGGLALVHSYDLVLYRWMAWPAPLPQALHIATRCDASVALEWGTLLEQQGRAAEAQQVYRATLEIDPFLDQVRARLTPDAQK